MMSFDLRPLFLLLGKLTDWFLYDRYLRHERGNEVLNR